MNADVLQFIRTTSQERRTLRAEVDGAVQDAGEELDDPGLVGLDRGAYERICERAALRIHAALIRYGWAVKKLRDLRSLESGGKP